MQTFKQNVIDVVKKIPKGGVMTYGEVAKRAGNGKASRVVGTIMAKNADTTVPCHRVIRADGSVGEYNGLRGKNKETILKEEGVMFARKKVVL